MVAKNSHHREKRVEYLKYWSEQILDDVRWCCNWMVFGGGFIKQFSRAWSHAKLPPVTLDWSDIPEGKKPGLEACGRKKTYCVWLEGRREWLKEKITSAKRHDRAKNIRRIRGGRAGKNRNIADLCKIIHDFRHNLLIRKLKVEDEKGICVKFYGIGQCSLD